MRGLVNIGESVWKAYEYSDLSKILNIHLFLTVRRVSNSEDAKIRLFNYVIHGTSSLCLK